MDTETELKVALPSRASPGRALAVALSPKGAIWAAAVVMFALSCFSLLNLAILEFGPWRGEAIALDELYFSACAVRGLDTGYIPSTGCQDNKAPLIFLAHQFVQAGNAPYSIVGIKIAAFVTAIILLMLIALITRRQGGNLAALTAAALALQALTSDAELLALKTEAVGSIFMLLGTLILTRTSRLSPLRWFAAGLMLGLAMMSKQTFVFAAAMILIWHWTQARFRSKPGLNAIAMSTSAFCLGIIIPALAFLAIFYAENHHWDYLSSVFLYPAVYSGPASSAGAIKVLIWRSASILADLTSAPLLFALFCAGLAHRAGRSNGETVDGRLWLLATMALGMLALPLIAPIYFSYHLIPAWLLMATTGGIALQEATANSARSPGEPGIGTAAALVALSLLTTAHGWLNNAGRGRDVELASKFASLTEHKGAYAYSLGGDPGFYVYNGLIPASNVGFVWALPSSQPAWNYTPPNPNTWQGRALKPIHDSNARRLIEDFTRTPPRFIALSSPPEAGGINTAIKLLDAYVAQHCDYVKPIKTRTKEQSYLYACTAPR